MGISTRDGAGAGWCGQLSSPKIGQKCDLYARIMYRYCTSAVLILGSVMIVLYYVLCVMSGRSLIAAKESV